jgi:hypothetical protein
VCPDASVRTLLLVCALMLVFSQGTHQQQGTNTSTRAHTAKLMTTGVEMSATSEFSSDLVHWMCWVEFIFDLEAHAVYCLCQVRALLLDYLHNELSEEISSVNPRSFFGQYILCWHWWHHIQFIILKQFFTLLSCVRKYQWVGSGRDLPVRVGLGHDSFLLNPLL